MPQREEILHLLFENTIKAASAKLSSFLSQKVEIEETSSLSVKLIELSDHLGPEERVYTVLAMRLSEDLGGTFMLLFDSQSLELLQDNILANYHIPTSQNEDIKREAIKEMGNILLGALLTEITKATNINVGYSVPDLARDMLKASLDEVTAELLLENQDGYLVESDVAINPLGIRIKIIVVLKNKSLDEILKGVTK